MSGRDKNIVGEVLAKTHRIERFLGAGSVGTVYVARHVRSGGLYAVKVLHRRLATSADVYQRFQDEARFIATLRHPHILPITDFDRDEAACRFCDGSPRRREPSAATETQKRRCRLRRRWK